MNALPARDPADAPPRHLRVRSGLLSTFLPILSPVLLPLTLLLALAAMAWLDAWSVKLLTKVFAVWIAVLGLHLLIVHAGILSLGHAAFVAIGAYSAGLLSLDGPHTLWAMLAVVVLACTAAGLLIGAAVLRTQGLYQLMATLAVAQMIYYGLQSLRTLGGDDGFALPHRPALLGWVRGGYGLESAQALGSATVLLAAVCAALITRLRKSELGATMQAAHDDAQRLGSLGVNVFAVRLLAFVVSSVLAGLGGALLAHVSGFASPQMGHWLFSGELMVLVLLGGLHGTASHLGTLLACAALVLAQEILARYTDHWPLALGLLVLARVLWPAAKGAR